MGKRKPKKRKPNSQEESPTSPSFESADSSFSDSDVSCDEEDANKFKSTIKMSTSRGNDIRKRPQKHQNRTAFKNDLHDTSKQTKILNSLEIVGVCPRCKSILEWKIKYKKYKPLTAPKKCTSCDQKNIRSAYHVLCSKCSRERKVCPKCCKGVDVEQDQPESPGEAKQEDLMSMLQGLPERKRRTVLRYIRKQQNGEEKITNEAKSYIEDILSKMDNVSLGDDDDSLFSDDDEDDDSVHSNENK